MQRRTLIRHMLATCTVLLAGPWIALPCAAQGSWPTAKTISYVVPFPLAATPTRLPA